MSSQMTLQQMADRVAQLMEERLKIGGEGLSAKLRRGGRKLPRRVRKAAGYLADAQDLARHPKIQMTLDDRRLAEAYDECLSYLRPLGGSERMKTQILGVGGSIALGLFVVAGLTLAVLVWRGLI